jgi:hypothetical protein
LAVLLALAVWLAMREMRRPTRRMLVVFALGVWLAGLGLVSTSWSVDPRLTFERAGSFTLALLAAAALALAARGRPRLPVWLLYGILGGVAAATLGGLVVLAVRHQDAVQAAGIATPTRYRGLGENPDTVSLLIGLTAPVALWAVLRARGIWGRIAATLVLVLLVGSLAASQSRGGLAVAGIGCVVQVLLLLPRWRGRLINAGAVALVVAAAVVIPHSASAAHSTNTGRLPISSASASPGRAGRATTPSYPAGHFKDAHYSGRLEDELYFHAGSYHRSLLGSSGRLEAWRGALNQIRGRPLLGYGFGTEERVFVDRFYDFQGSYVENSFLGLGLQLGIVGVVSMVALFAAIAVASVPALRRPRKLGDPAPALVAAGIAGLLLMLVQSYVYSVGDVATTSFWVMVFLLAGLPGQRQPLTHVALSQKEEHELAPGARSPSVTA